MLSTEELQGMNSEIGKQEKITGSENIHEMDIENRRSIKMRKDLYIYECNELIREIYRPQFNVFDTFTAKTTWKTNPMLVPLTINRRTDNSACAQIQIAANNRVKQA